MAVTIRDVAATAEVSVATVSKVMNNKDTDISTATRERVREVARVLGYRTNSLARSLRTRQSKVIGSVLPNYTASLFGPMTDTLDETCAARGYTLTSMSSHNLLETELDVVGKLRSSMVEGIVVYRIYAEEAADILEAAGCPVVFIDRFRLPIVEGTGQIFFNTSASIMEAVYLLRQEGARHIGLVSNSRNHGGVRYAAYREALRNSGLEFNEELVAEGDNTFSAGRRAVRHMLDQGVEVDGLICGNDLVAEGALTALRDHGLSMPDDVRIIASDVTSMTSGFHRPFTCISLPSGAIGHAAANMLIDHLEGKAPLSSVEIPYTVITGTRMRQVSHLTSRAASYLVNNDIPAATPVVSSSAT